MTAVITQKDSPPDGQSFWREDECSPVQAAVRWKSVITIKIETYFDLKPRYSIAETLLETNVN